MRADLIATVDDAVFGSLADTVTVGGVSAEAIYDPEDADVPGTELARRSERVLKLAFRESDTLDPDPRDTRAVPRRQLLDRRRDRRSGRPDRRGARTDRGGDVAALVRCVVFRVRAVGRGIGWY